MRKLILGFLLLTTWPLKNADATEPVQAAQGWKNQMGRTSLILRGTEGQVELNDVQVELKESGSQIGLRIQFGFANARSKPIEFVRALAARWTHFEQPMVVVELNGKTDKKIAGDSGYISFISERAPFKVQGLTLSRPAKHPLVPSRSERKLELDGVFESREADRTGKTASWSIRLEGWLEK
jgi:hypothetical protein